MTVAMIMYIFYVGRWSCHHLTSLGFSLSKTRGKISKRTFTPNRQRHDKERNDQQTNNRIRNKHRRLKTKQRDPHKKISNEDNLSTVVDDKNKILMMFYIKAKVIYRCSKVRIHCHYNILTFHSQVTNVVTIWNATAAL